jgi:hypothetical protein
MDDGTGCRRHEREVIPMSASPPAVTRSRRLLAWPRGVIQRTVTGSARLVGAGLLVAIGLIHLALAPTYSSAAAYVGVLFHVAGAAAWASALGIIIGVRGAWLLGGVIAAGAFAALVVSATVGLPHFTDSLSAPWAMLSLMLEGIFVACYAAAAVLRRNLLLQPGRKAVARPGGFEPPRTDP